MEEDEPVPKRKLIKKGPALTQTLTAKRAKTASTKPATRIIIQEPTPWPTKINSMATARRNKGKNVEITSKFLHLEDLKYNEMMVAIAKKSKDESSHSIP